MVRITVGHTASVDMDGSSTQKFLIDIAKELSQRYGKLIRQGQLFKIKSAGVRVYNPNTLVQDNLLSASGRLLFYSPTKHRKDAWKSAFRAVQNLRKTHGLKSKNYDFRVGLESSFGEVVNQAWIRDEDETLNLGGIDDDQNAIFSVHNAQLDNTNASPPDERMNGFGTPYDVVGINALADLDFKEGLYGDSPYFVMGAADQTMDSVPYSVAHAGAFDNSGIEDYGAVTNAENIIVDSMAMCGLVGVTIDTQIPDDSELQTEDYGIQVTLDIEKWTPIFQRRNKKKGKK